MKPSRKMVREQRGILPSPSSTNRLYQRVAEIIDTARSQVIRSINSTMVYCYWLVGREIVEHEQRGQARAEYGVVLLKTLAARVAPRFGRGFGWRNLFQMRAFYLAYPHILQTVSAKSSKLALTQKLQTASAISAFDVPSQKPLLPWSHYVRLLAVKNVHARAFYELEALRGGWSFRQLDRQIQSQFYERTALSKNKLAMLKKGSISRPEDSFEPEEAIKDPLVLEFLNLKDEYSESDLEEGLIRKLQTFLLELGGDFAFVDRQRRLRIGDEWYRIDLLLFHRRLRALLIIDLKLGKFTHSDVGQMHLYLNYAREHWTLSHENPPVGLILCAEKNDAIAHYALASLPTKVLAAEYRTTLPDEKLIAAELKRTRRVLEARGSPVRESSN